jgi:hypothetical protein
MAQFWVLIESGEDQRFERLTAISLDRAREEITRDYHTQIVETWDPIISMTIIKGQEFTFDIENVRHAHEQTKKTASYKAKEAEEKATYERLRLKFDPIAAREVAGLHPNRPAKGGDWDGDCG